ncbi:hypothetical protein HPHPH30_0895 [Helicobacter pylori Hp H-30]|nr:hypothetical protein HPHPH30_0895 [Helicobacter pylori Hp H-30]
MHESLKNEKILRKVETKPTLPNHHRDGTNYSVSNLYFKLLRAFISSRYYKPIKSYKEL